MNRTSSLVVGSLIVVHFTIAFLMPLVIHRDVIHLDPEWLAPVFIAG